MEYEWYHWAITIVGGFVAGIINTLAGNGSAITLTILSEVLGLPGNLANGTNRVGVFLQGTGSSYGFWRNGKLRLDTSDWRIILPCFIGAMFGVYTAINVSSDQFRQVFRFFMVVMIFVVLVKPSRWLKPEAEGKPIAYPILLPLLLVLGFYGGFIQMGMGIFFLAITVLGAKIDLLRSNALKAVVIALYTLPVMLIFWYQGLIAWKVGLVLATAQMIGGVVTANIASNHPQANLWAYRILVFVLILATLHLFGVFKYLILQVG